MSPGVLRFYKSVKIFKKIIMIIMKKYIYIMSFL